MCYSRRRFLARSLAGTMCLSLGPGVPDVLRRAAVGALEAMAGRHSSPSDRILVVLQLSGGNDGLNSVVPHADDNYARNRRTLRLRADEVQRIDDYCGWHPELRPLGRLFDQGMVSVIQAVGYANSHRGHDEAMRHWHTAQSDDLFYPTGWIGRAADVARRPGEPDLPGVFVGSIAQPFALRARRSVVPSLRRVDQWIVRRTHGASDGAGSGGGGATSPPPAPNHEAKPKPTAPSSAVADPAGARPADLVDFVRRAEEAAWDTSRKVEAVLARGATAAGYPDCPLGADLSTVAQLIRAELGIRIFFTELGGGGIGGFDNHAGQRDNHAALLRQLAQSVAAFADDLRREGLFDRVVLMTFSEFGRTLAENGRRGTDHGAAQPVFLVGGALRGGLFGDPPDLATLDQGASEARIDFRRVYATLLDRWLGLDAPAVLGAAYEPLDVLKG